MRPQCIIQLRVIKSSMTDERFIVSVDPTPDIDCPFYTTAWNAVYVKYCIGWRR